MRKRSAVALITLIPLAALQLLVVAPATLAASSGTAAQASAANSYPTAAYVFNDANYDSYNSSGEGFDITGTTPGHYDVTLYGLGLVASKVIAEVTPVTDAATCAVNSFSAVETELDVVVSCYDFAGGPSAPGFNLLVTHPYAPPHGVFDYALMNSPDKSRTLGRREYNSSHKKNSVKFLGTGRYQVTFGGPKSSGTHGTIKVSPFGDSAGDCSAVSWHGFAHGEVADVDCYDATGALANREFTITYASASNLLGLGNVATANAYASRDATHKYQPSVHYNSDRHARVTILHESTGVYLATFAGSEGTLANGGDVQVTAVAGSDRHCGVTDWDQMHNPNADIVCTNNAGVPVNTKFIVNWVVG
jgi:hypothetical protein